ncbi:MAG: hypothetical protein IJY50_06270 [Clostridia bacterium]|nr:hypothetical protein [Clostridia bacterium]
MWYSSSYRRHLCDMHIEDWDPTFLSQFDPDAYFENLKRANVDAAMIYLQSHVGLCNFPTKEGKMHKAFVGRENALAELIGKCRQNGIAVVGYYSLTHDNEVYDTHPDWRMLDENGIGKRGTMGKDGKYRRYGYVCPNHEEYRAFTLRRIDEMAAYARMDGMFYDMPFWPHYCHCPKCRARFMQETGWEIPKGDFSDTPVWRSFLKKQQEWMAEFIQLVTDYTKRVMPGASVEHNVAYAALPSYNKGMSMDLMRACDYAGGDLYGTAYEHSFTCKFYYATTTHQPFEYMFSRCTPGLRKHTLTKSEDRIHAAVMLTCANHGATLFIDAIDPVGTLDQRVYERIGNVFDFEKRYEKYLTGTPVSDVGIYYGFHSRFPVNGNEYTNSKCAPRLARRMIEQHIPHSVVGGEFGDLESNRVIYASCVDDEEGKGIDRLLSYVEKGGKLIFTDGRSKKLLRVLLGTDDVTLCDCANTYVAPTAAAGDLLGDFNAKYPLPIDGFAPVVRGVTNGTVLATFNKPYTATRENKFASIHSNPPGVQTAIPAIVEGTYGKGCFIWLAHVPEFDVEEEYTFLIKRLIARLTGGDFAVETDAPADVEIVTFRDGNAYLLSAAQLTDAYTARQILPFRVSLKVAGEVQDVLLLPNETSIPFTQSDDTVSFSVENFHIFDMFKIVTK